MMIGQSLGHYRIDELIDVGGMATVYKAFDPNAERYVALKVLSENYAQNPQFIQRFQREVRVIARLEHPYILPIFGVGEQNGTIYLVMRYLPLGSLANRLAAKGALNPEKAGVILNQICSALDYAHENGVLHRDIKPANILLDARGNAYLSDFGISKIIGSTILKTTTGVVLGTPAYMSPEQCAGESKNLTPATDLYSLGVVLYEMLTGQVPFSGDNFLAVINQHLRVPVPSPRIQRPDLPLSIEQVISKALAKEPDMRYGCCMDLAAAYEQAIGEKYYKKTTELPEKQAVPLSSPDAAHPAEAPATEPYVAAPPVQESPIAKAPASEQSGITKIAAVKNPAILQKIRLYRIQTGIAVFSIFVVVALICTYGITHFSFLKSPSPSPTKNPTAMAISIPISTATATVIPKPTATATATHWPTPTSIHSVLIFEDMFQTDDMGWTGIKGVDSISQGKLLLSSPLMDSEWIGYLVSPKKPLQIDGDCTIQVVIDRRVRFSGLYFIIPEGYFAIIASQGDKATWKNNPSGLGLLRPALSTPWDSLGNIEYLVSFTSGKITIKLMFVGQKMTVFVDDYLLTSRTQNIFSMQKKFAGFFVGNGDSFGVEEIRVWAKSACTRNNNIFICR